MGRLSDRTLVPIGPVFETPPVTEVGHGVEAKVAFECSRHEGHISAAGSVRGLADVT